MRWEALPTTIGLLLLGPGCGDRAEPAMDGRVVDGAPADLAPRPDAGPPASDGSPADAPAPDVARADGPPIVPRQILFGYAFSQDGLDQNQDHISLVHVVADPEGDADLQALQQAEAAGLRVVLSTVGAYFSARCDEYYTDRQGVIDKWRAYAQKIAPYAAVIEAFHVLDEPYWVCHENQGMSRQDVARLLDELGVMIKADFPGIKLLTVFGGFSVNDQLSPPAAYEWLSFDCYYYYDSCGDAAHGRRSIPEYLALLKQRSSAQQRIVLLPPAYDAVPTPLIREMALKYFQLAAETPEVVAVVPFLWSADGLVGLRDLPAAQPIFREIGNVLSGAGACPNTPPAAGPVLSGATTLCGAPVTRIVRGDEDLFLRLAGASLSARLCIEPLDAGGTGRCADPDDGASYAELHQGGGWLYSRPHGEWRTILTRFALEQQPVGRYRLHAHDPATGRSAQTTIELVAPAWDARLAVRISKIPDGPRAIGFRRAVDPVHWRVDHAREGTTYACVQHVANDPTDKCSDPTGEHYQPLAPPDWAFDRPSGRYRATSAPTAFAEAPPGLYHLYFSERQTGQLTAAILRLAP